MAFLKWDDSYSVRIVEIDQQHQKLIGMINDLHEAMRQGKGKDILQRILTGLAEYTAIHFATEERYFEQFGYPGAAAHKKEHREFVSKVEDFKGRFEQDKLSMSIEVMRFLRDWLSGHIKGSDAQYGPFFNQKGLR